MTGHLLLTVQKEEEGRRLGDYLRKKGITHTLLVMMKRQGMILCNGEPSFTTIRVNEGDRITLSCREEKTTDNVAPEEGKLSVLYEDEDVLALDKPAGLAVHPSRAHTYGTLAGRVMYYYRGQEFVFRAVNRLDLGTGGVMLIAKNPLAAAWFAAYADMRKEYLCLTEGKFPEELRMELPIAREAEEEMRRVVRADGEWAATRARRLAYGGNRSLVKCRLESGRTHQIRVHMAHIGYPLLGDPLYGKDHPLLHRQALHAAEISFLLPYSATRLTLSAPLPEDMKLLLP